MVENDLPLVLAWRNSERIRAASFGDREISMDEHRAWFSGATATGRSRSFIFDVDDRPAGVVNFTNIDAVAGTSEWGFYIGEPSAPKGSGAAMGFLALEEAFGSMKLSAITGRTLGRNPASAKYHEKLGFLLVRRLPGAAVKNGQSDDVLEYRLDAPRWAELKTQLAKRCFQENEPSIRK
jgi:UDP-4-amino-4,6-dideoxy-N-acetyl-beta-L-altrosamine N-acetyltransferase